MSKKRSTSPPDTGSVVVDESTPEKTEFEQTKEQLRLVLNKRYDLGFRGKRRHLAPDSIKNEIKRLSAKLRTCKHTADVKRFGKFSGTARRKEA